MLRFAQHDGPFFHSFKTVSAAPGVPSMFDSLEQVARTTAFAVRVFSLAMMSQTVVM